ncbi:50S ribosomal protein L6 [Blastopirellula marina]|uniref:Large ribosomal subunit protein uL6 n=1 Tax=Blastopirellula marina TaxID=124 RepID=A0A2S8FH32_9BACT|nr:50S ribosomal protein L6 [Blastopirellula marina]PQO31456.1 50S ribosomal protein L6 [Blastopirellula marina]PTL42761.1 50S ribosomal protein L6 [Blastopirellula marina]
MSRLGRKPVALPEKVKVSVDGQTVNVEGPLGKLSYTAASDITIELGEDGKEVTVSRKNDSRTAKAMHGLTRALISNMVVGVDQGYEKRLEVVGVGYLAAIAGDVLQLRVGFANEVHKKIPSDLDVKCPDQTHIVVKGIDKQRVGQFAAEVRAVRKPEPYKGKGVRYQGERVKLKPGKAAGK